MTREIKKAVESIAIAHLFALTIVGFLLLMGVAEAGSTFAGNRDTNAYTLTNPTHYMAFGTATSCAAGTPVSLDSAIDACGQMPSNTTVTNVHVEIIGNTGSRSTNPLSGGEEVTIELREARVSGNTWVDNGLLLTLDTVTSGFTFPYQNNHTFAFDASNKMLYAIMEYNGITTRTFSIEIHLDLDIGGSDSNVLSGEIAVTTAFDQWIATLILGGVAVLFAVVRFFLPMIAAIISLVAQFFDPPIWGIPGSVMLIGIFIILQIMLSAFVFDRE